MDVILAGMIVHRVLRQTFLGLRQKEEEGPEGPKALGDKDDDLFYSEQMNFKAVQGRRFRHSCELFEHCCRWGLLAFALAMEPGRYIFKWLLRRSTDGHELSCYRTQCSENAML